MSEETAVPSAHEALKRLLDFIGEGFERRSLNSIALEKEWHIANKSLAEGPAPTLLAQRDALAEALRPFGAFEVTAQHATQADDFAIYATEQKIDGKTVTTEITVGDFRRARAALAAVGRG